jgi:hypothetical protein
MHRFKHSQYFAFGMSFRKSQFLRADPWFVLMKKGRKWKGVREFKRETERIQSTLYASMEYHNETPSYYQYQFVENKFEPSSDGWVWE